MNTIIDPSVLKNLDALSQRYAKAQPFRHVLIENFLEPDLAERLVAEFPAFENGNCIGDDGRPGGKSTIERMRLLGPAYRSLDHVVQQPDFLALIGRITGIDELLYDP
ncbi:MAG: 2OG-Fe(II) oxygenase, partial [Rudaea sp.]